MRGRGGPEVEVEVEVSTYLGERQAWSGGTETAALAGTLGLIGACTVGVVVLADGAAEGGGTALLDPGVAAAVLAERNPALDAIAGVVTWLGGPFGLGLLALLAILGIGWVRGSWRQAATRCGGAVASLAVALAGSVALTLGLKLLVGRSRPPAWMVVGPVETGYAFPSGHTLNATVLAAVVATLALPRLRTRVQRAAIVAAAAGFSLGVGASRIYLGYHWFTDVLAGWLVALGWLGVLLAGRSVWRRRGEGVLAGALPRPTTRRASAAPATQLPSAESYDR